MKLEFRSVVFEKRGKPENLEKKLLEAKERTNNKLNPHGTSGSGSKHEPHDLEESLTTTRMRHHCFPSTSSQLPDLD